MSRDAKACVRLRSGILFVRQALSFAKAPDGAIRSSSEGRAQDTFEDSAAADVGGKVMQNLKIIVEKHPDGYVAYPLGIKGVVVGEGESYEDALADVRSAFRFHIEQFGKEVLTIDPPILEAFVAEAEVSG